MYIGIKMFVYVYNKICMVFLFWGIKGLELFIRFYGDGWKGLLFVYDKFKSEWDLN